MYFKFFSDLKKYKEKLRVEKIESMVLGKWIGQSDFYTFTLDKYYYTDFDDFYNSKHFIEYSNEYLYNFILRDVIIELLKGSVVYAYTPDLDAFGDLYTAYPYYEKSYIIECDHIDKRLVSELILFYSEIWEWAYPALFLAYDNKKSPEEIEDIKNFNKWDDYIIKIEAVPDNIGIDIYIDNEKMTEEELISRVKKVLDNYKLSLKFEVAKIE
ncbi:MAG: hypothetical protein GX219_05660 [Tissierellia bacterium]|nr:hypothetical protein [Tissierellia bacterium]